MLVVKADGKPVEGLDRWMEIWARGIADVHSYDRLDIRIDLPQELSTNTHALRRIAGLFNAVAEEADARAS